MQQLSLALIEPPAPTFDNFLAGNNARALTVLSALPRARPGKCIYLHGAPASGRTHLLRASVAAMPEEAEACYLGIGDRLMPDAALMDTDRPLALPRLLAVDDIERQPPGIVQWLFGRMVAADAAATHFVVAGSQPPALLPLRDDLRTRLGLGLVLALSTPDEPLCETIIQQHARALGLELGDGVLRYLMHHAARDLGALLRLLQQIDRRALQAKRRITLPLARAVLCEVQSGLSPNV